MGMEVSTYIGALQQHIRNNYGGWSIEEHKTASDSSDGAWGVQLGIVDIEPEWRGDSNGMHYDITCSATVFYNSKAPTHDKVLQALDIALSLGAFLDRHTLQGGDGLNINEAAEVIPGGGVFQEVNYRDGVSFASGHYRVNIPWKTRVFVTPQIEIEGYTTTNPPIPGSGVDIDEIILIFTKTPDREELTRITVTD